MHLDAESLERLLHGELDPGREAAVRSHLATCPACEARLRESRALEARLFDLLEELDHEPPGVDWKAVVHAPTSRWRASSRIAASIAFLLLAGGILYALPESSVRGWIDRLLGRDDIEAPATGAGSGSEEASVSGLTVRPGASFDVVFATRQAVGTIRVTLVGTMDLELRILGAPVELESGPDRLTVSNVDSRSSYELLVPESAPSIRVRVRGEDVFVKDGDTVRTAALHDSAGSYVLDLGGPDP
jgi:hypothetical protein